MKKKFFKISINANSNENLPSDSIEQTKDKNENDESSILFSSCAVFENVKPKFNEIFPSKDE